MKAMVTTHTEAIGTKVMTLRAISTPISAMTAEMMKTSWVGALRLIFPSSL
jgi:hypothetical protein